MNDPTPTPLGVDAREAAAPPSLEGPNAEAERLLKQASPGRFFVRLAIALAVLGALGVAGLYGHRALEVRRAKGVPMRGFDGGKTTIGSDARVTEEAPAHEVDVGAFELDVTEVTVGAYRACVQAGTCSEPLEGDFCNWGKDDTSDHPINCVTFEQAETYCKWADKRLPTEVEWEHAAGRGQDERLFPWGDDLPGPRTVNACGAECRAHGAKKGKVWPAMHDFDDGFPTTAPVGSFPGGDSADGLKDMAGNVWEWTASPYCIYPEHDCINNAERIIRGGGWTNQFELTFEVTTRELVNPKDAVEAVGFRCAR